jgi:hypothetical protein
MFNANAGITFAATIEQPKCPAKLRIEDIEIFCSLVHGHRQKRHQFNVLLEEDDTTIEIYWTKKRVVKEPKDAV